MQVSRRELLRKTGGILTASSIAGCNVLSDSSYTTVNLEIIADERAFVEITMFDPDTDKNRDAVVFFEQIELEGETLENGFSSTYERAFKSKRVIVEIKTVADVRQFSYFPNCTKENRGESLSVDYRVDADKLDYRTGCSPE